MNRIYRVIWNCTLQVFQACSELTRRAGKTSTVNLRKSSGLTTKFSRLTLGVLLALSGSASGASLEVDNDQITNIDTDVAYDAYLVGWYGTGVLNILAGGNASLTTITTSVIGANEDSEGTVNVLGGTWRLYDSGNNARPLNVGQSGTGTLNIKQKGHVDGGYLRLGSSTGGVGTVNVEGEDSVLTTELFEIGSYGTGSLNITDKGYVTSSIVAILGYQAGSNGQVVVEKGGEWLIKNNDSSIEFQIGNQGTGEATIREGGLITAENTIIGGNATGIGTLNVQDQDSVITVRRLYNGYFGNGTLNISNNGLINNKEYSLVGVQDGSHGVPVEWLTDNGSCYRANETRQFARMLGLEPKSTAVRSPESNGIAESFVKTIKRDYISVMPKPDGLTAAKNLAEAFEHYNEWHPHSALGYRSPREYLRQQASNGLSDNRCLEI